MAKGTYIGVNNVARKTKKMYVGVNGVAREVKKVYVGVNGVARLCYSAEPETISFTQSTGTVTTTTFKASTGNSYSIKYHIIVRYIVTLTSSIIKSINDINVSTYPVVRVRYGTSSPGNNTMDVVCDDCETTISGGTTSKTVTITFKGYSKTASATTYSVCSVDSIITTPVYVITCNRK